MNNCQQENWWCHGITLIIKRTGHWSCRCKLRALVGSALAEDSVWLQEPLSPFGEIDLSEQLLPDFLSQWDGFCFQQPYQLFLHVDVFSETVWVLMWKPRDPDFGCGTACSFSQAEPQFLHFLSTFQPSILTSCNFTIMWSILAGPKSLT